MVAAEAAFPGIPERIVVDALDRLDAERAEASWQAVERCGDRAGA